MGALWERVLAHVVDAGHLAVAERLSEVLDTAVEPHPALDGRTVPGIDLVPLDPVVRHVFADGTVLDSSSAHAEFLDRIAAALGAEAAHDWDRFWHRARRIWDASWRSVLRRPVTPASLAGLSIGSADLSANLDGGGYRMDVQARLTGIDAWPRGATVSPSTREIRGCAALLSAHGAISRPLFHLL